MNPTDLLHRAVTIDGEIVEGYRYHLHHSIPLILVTSDCEYKGMTVAVIEKTVKPLVVKGEWCYRI